MKEESMIFESKESGTFVECPNGTYMATVKSAEVVTTARGEAVKFAFALDKVQDSDGRPAELWGFAAPKLTNATKLFRWSEAILARPINYRAAERIGLSDLVGGRVKVVVENELVDGRNRPRIEKLLPANVREAVEPEAAERCWCGAAGTSYLPDGVTMLCDVHTEHAQRARAAGVT